MNVKIIVAVALSFGSSCHFLFGSTHIFPYKQELLKKPHLDQHKLKLSNRQTFLRSGCLQKAVSWVFHQKCRWINMVFNHVNTGICFVDTLANVFSYVAVRCKSCRLFQWYMYSLICTFFVGKVLQSENRTICCRFRSFVTVNKIELPLLFAAEPTSMHPSCHGCNACCWQTYHMIVIETLC